MPESPFSGGSAVRISHKYRFVFFAFPKTGSESVRKALDPLSDVRGQMAIDFGKTADGEDIIPDHATPMEVRALFREKGWPFEEYFRFVFVRNPWTRLVSLYRFIQQPGTKAPFEEWLLNSRTSGRGGGEEGQVIRRSRRFGTYTLDNFVCDETGTRLVDQVFRMEDMASVPAQLRGRGIPIAGDFIPAVNRQPPVDINAYYTPALRAVVAMRYAKDIAEFHYRYPG
jgi:hypothetical protein